MRARTSPALRRSCGSPKWRTSSRGFTLIQILVAVAILAIALVPASSVFIASTRNVQKGDLTLTAAMAAQTLLDDLRERRELFTLNPGAPYLLPHNALPGLVIPPAFQAVLHGAAEVVADQDPFYPGLARLVTVRIKYKEYGVDRESVLSTIMPDTRNRNLRRMQ